MIDANSETELINWLQEFEQIGISDDMMAYYDNVFNFPFRTDYFEVKDLKINSCDFDNVFQFKVFFDRYYWSLLEHYKVENITELLNAN